MLTEFDTNGDRIIDANDADFSNLVVWIDAAANDNIFGYDRYKIAA